MTDSKRPDLTRRQALKLFGAAAAGGTLAAGSVLSSAAADSPEAGTAAGTTASAGAGQMGAERYAQAERLLWRNLQPLIYQAALYPNWTGDADRFWYATNTREGVQHFMADPETNRLEPFEPAPSPPPAESGLAISPDGRFTVKLRDYNLFVNERPFTTDGVADHAYAIKPDSRFTTIPDRVHQVRPTPQVVWSPDSSRFATFRLDQRNVRMLHLTQATAPDGALTGAVHSLRFSMPGDPVLPTIELMVFDAGSGKRLDLRGPKLQIGSYTPVDFQQLWWSDDGETVWFLEAERGEKAFRLWSADARSGECRALIEERSDTTVMLHPLWAVRPNVRTLDSGDILWWSERDGWGHLYRYSATGKLLNRVTQGDWVVHDILRVDDEAVWFTAGGREPGRDPYYPHLYRASLDGRSIELLTPEDAHHQVMISPSGQYFVDTASRVDLPPVARLRRRDGSLVRVLQQADISELTAMGIRLPERFSAKARDGETDIYGVIVRPRDFDPARRYPVIDMCYPGPQATFVPKSFGGMAILWNCLAMAELGFIVVGVDGLGTPMRSKAIHDAQYGNLGDCGLPDHIAALRQLAARDPSLDLDRVGIIGHSGGGLQAARGVLAHPDFYKVAVSSAGSHDAGVMASIWGEKWQGLPDQTDYDLQRNPLLAANLRGKLLLMYSELDENVPPATTVQLVEALIAANKDFDLVLFPNWNHTFTQHPYYLRKSWDFLVQHLLGQTPPPGFAFSFPAPPAPGRIS